MAERPEMLAGKVAGVAPGMVGRLKPQPWTHLGLRGDLRHLDAQVIDSLERFASLRVLDLSRVIGPGELTRILSHPYFARLEEVRTGASGGSAIGTWRTPETRLVVEVFEFELQLHQGILTLRQARNSRRLAWDALGRALTACGHRGPLRASGVKDTARLVEVTVAAGLGTPDSS